MSSSLSWNDGENGKHSHTKRMILLNEGPTAIVLYHTDPNLNPKFRDSSKVAQLFTKMAGKNGQSIVCFTVQRAEAIKMLGVMKSFEFDRHTVIGPPVDILPLDDIKDDHRLVKLTFGASTQVKAFFVRKQPSGVVNTCFRVSEVSIDRKILYPQLYQLISFHAGFVGFFIGWRSGDKIGSHCGADIGCVFDAIGVAADHRKLFLKARVTANLWKKLMGNKVCPAPTAELHVCFGDLNRLTPHLTNRNGAAFCIQSTELNHFYARKIREFYSMKIVTPQDKTNMNQFHSAQKIELNNDNLQMNLEKKKKREKPCEQNA